MLPWRFVSLLLLMLSAHVWCKPAKSSEPEYSDDDPEDYSDDDASCGGSPNSAEKPRILSEGKEIYERIGSTIMLPCLLEHAEHCAIMWQKGDEPLYSDAIALTQDSKRIVRLPNNTLVIYNANVDDSASYECSILTKLPIAIRHNLSIQTAEVLASTPRPQHTSSLIRVTPQKKVQLVAGDTVKLGCEVAMNPQPKIKWFHQNKKVDDSMILDGNHIIINNATRHDSGPYQCLVEDFSVQPPMGAINVTVKYAPEIDVEKDWVHSGLGVKSKLTCIVHAHPHANVSWMWKNGTIISPHGTSRIQMQRSKGSHNLIIHPTEAHDFGEYTCVAQNDLGSADKIITLTGAPSQAIISSGKISRTETGLTLKWRLESYSPITEYTLQYRRVGEMEWTTVKPKVEDGKGNQFTVEHPIEGLEPGSYEAILKARNEFGWSRPSVPHIFTGEYIMEEADNIKGSAVMSQPMATMVAFLLVISCAFRSL